MGLLNKVNEQNININLLQNAKNIAAQEGEYRICFYTIPDYSNVLDTAEERARLMLKSGFSIKGMSRKYIANVFGECFADSIYSIKSNCSFTNTMIQEYIESFILKKVFDEYGYFCKDMLLGKDLIIKGHRISRYSIEFEYRRCLPEILDKYGLLLIRANKEIALRYNTVVRKTIIIKNE